MWDYDLEMLNRIRHKMRKKIAKDRKAKGENYWKWGSYKIKEHKNEKRDKNNTNKSERIIKSDNNEK